MYLVSVEDHFDAAHYLRNYRGKCENLHGHRFKVVATIEVDEVDENGLAYDFVELKQHLAKVLSAFDHVCINEVPPFDRINASSENMARVIYEQLSRQFTSGIKVHSIEVWESPQSKITYRPS